MEAFTIRMYSYMNSSKQERDRVDLLGVNKLGDTILKFNSKQIEMINGVRENARYSDIDLSDMPRPALSAYNKTVEIYKIFRETGVDFLSSPLFDRISEQIMEMIEKSNNDMTDFTNFAMDVTTRHNKQLILAQQTGPLSKFFSKIKSFFSRQPQKELPEISEEDMKTLQEKRAMIEEEDSKIAQYCIEKDLIPHVIDRLQNIQDSEWLFIEMSECIQDLTALGYGEYVPIIEQAVRDDYISKLSAKSDHPLSVEEKHEHMEEFASELAIATTQTNIEQYRIEDQEKKEKGKSLSDNHDRDDSENR
ncbi:MAG: hypothetical protein IKE91_07585 [Clostridia bacterium]|nr:hypothetical protein [Clostridia bacterium]